MARCWRAVLFDLFGTLVLAGTRSERDRVSRAMAGDLGVDPHAFATKYRDSFDQRTRGLLGTLEETIATLATELGATPTSDAIARAARRRIGLTSNLLNHGGALPVLDRLRADGYLLGLVSDCSAETPPAWPHSELARRIQATSFSCITGIRKPQSETYLAVTHSLKVEPQACVFVGDGGSSELSGARKLGMRAILLRDADEIDGIERPDEEVEWDGEQIASLDALPSLL